MVFCISVFCWIKWVEFNNFANRLIEAGLITTFQNENRCNIWMGPKAMQVWKTKTRYSWSHPRSDAQNIGGPIFSLGGGRGLHTVYLILLHTPSFLVEIRVIIKISKNPCYPINVDWFSLEWSKKKKKNSKKKFKMADSKKPHFPAPPILNIFSWKFHGLVLGLVGLIDAKGIDMAQRIWPWGCPT